MDILVIAAHPDDEVLGMGATIKKLSKQKNKIHLCMVSDGAAAVKDKKSLIAKRKEACLKSGKLLGISTFDFLMFPDMKLDDIPVRYAFQPIKKELSYYLPTPLEAGEHTMEYKISDQAGNIISGITTFMVD